MKSNQVNQPIKVAHIITRLIIGGAQENTVFSVIGLQEQSEYEVHLISGTEKGPEGRLDLGEVQNIIFEPSLQRALNPVKDLICLYKLFSLFREKRYDIVHTHSAKAGVLGRLAAWLAGVPCIIHTIHGLPFHPYQSSIKNGLYILIERLCSRPCKRIIVVANEMKRKALAVGIGKEQQYRLIHSGMKLDLFKGTTMKRHDFRQNLGLSPEATVIGKVARFFPLKGHELFFDTAFDLLRERSDLHFLLVGDGILLNQFKERVKDHQLEEHFIFTGLVDPDDIPVYIGAMDILVHTSLREGLARVIPQSMAVGTPVISLAIDGAVDAITDGENGFLVFHGANEKSDLKAKILKLLVSPDLANSFRKSGLEAVDPEFSRDTMVEKIVALYASCNKAENESSRKKGDPLI